MEIVVFMLAVAPVVSNFIGFLAGAPGDRLLRRRLADFYVSMQGSWTNIYRRPASLTARYLIDAFGGRPLLFPLYIAFYSVITTSLLTMAHLNLAIPQGVDSAGPILSGAGGFDLGLFWSMYLAPNLVGDLICWPISLLLFVRLAHARPLAAAAISGLIVAISLFAFVLVARLQVWEWDFLSIPTSFPDLSLPHRFDPEQGPDTAWIRASSALHELGFPTDAFTFDYWGVVPLAVFLPALVLGATTLCAVLIVAARPLLYRPLMLIVERLDASSKTLFDLLSAFLLGLAVLVTAVRILLKAG